MTRAAEPFNLPECRAALGGEVLLNAALLDAMIIQAEPGGARPDPQLERVLIVLQHYAMRSNALLLVPRSAADQRPVWLTPTCAPYPEVPQHIHIYVSELTPEQQRALITYHDLVMPHVPQAPPPPPAPAPDPRMAQIPAGTVRSGDGTTVTLPAFALDIYEVTNADYRQFIEVGGYTTEAYWTSEGWAWLQNKPRQQPTYWDMEGLKAPDQPVVGVTWYEADTYCRWAGKTLPTVLQWEKACRGQDGRPFPWGRDPWPATLMDAGRESSSPSTVVPVTVGSVPETQSPYGVHDLAGNVLEWTSTVTNQGGVVLCGGSGSAWSPHVGCGVRTTLLPGITANFVGFRCQKTLP